LKNGWVVALQQISPNSYGLTLGGLPGGGDTASYTATSHPGDTQSKATVSWHADNCGEIMYWDDFQIDGPMGVPPY
jgi:hypothetical protein